jgi:hypothetical protein
MSTSYGYFTIGIFACGFFGSFIMKNTNNSVEKSIKNYKTCEKYWHKAQKFKILNMVSEFRKKKRNFIFCCAENSRKIQNKISKRPYINLGIF